MNPTPIAMGIWMAYGRTPNMYFAAHWVMWAQARAERMAAPGNRQTVYPR